MKCILTGFIAIIVLAWGLELSSPAHLSAGSLPWVIYQEGLHLSGLLAIAMMSLAMVLATRPVWLEGAVGGMDRVYRLHKWSGILALAFAALHWLIEMSDDPIKALAGRGGRHHKDDFSAFAEPLRDAGEELGEFAIYILFALLALSLWRRFSYRLWRPLHRAMPLLYLMLAFHSVVLAPAGYWSQPVGLLLAVLLGGGAIASALSLGGRIGRQRRARGTLRSVQRLASDIVEVDCRLEQGWRGHRPGQFAFVTFDSSEGAHPFTIASADRGDGSVRFAIKALGDYTRKLPGRLEVGDAVQVEGPYGRFVPGRTARRAQQIWVAGGIGITPFLAWLESLQGNHAAGIESQLHYCVRERENDPFVARLQALCANLPGVSLHLHDNHSGRLTAERLASGAETARPVEVWFCGPRGLGESLQQGLRQYWQRRVRFHQEAFEMR